MVKVKKEPMPRDVNQRGAAIVSQVAKRYEVEDPSPVAVLTFPDSTLRKVLRLPVGDEAPQSQPTNRSPRSSKK